MTEFVVNPSGEYVSAGTVDIKGLPLETAAALLGIVGPLPSRYIVEDGGVIIDVDIYGTFYRSLRAAVKKHLPVETYQALYNAGRDSMTEYDG